MSSLYYVGVGVVSLSMSIYNFNTMGESNNQTCYVYKSMTFNETQDYYNSLAQPVPDMYANESEFKDKMEVPVQESNPYKTFCLLVGIVYIILLAMSLFLACITNYLSNQLPDDYINMGTCKKFLACFCKILPPCFIILSWLNFIFFIVVWIFILSKNYKSGIYSIIFAGVVSEPSYEIMNEFAAPWMKLEIIILSELNQRKTNII